MATATSAATKVITAAGAPAHGKVVKVVCKRNMDVIASCAYEIEPSSIRTKNHPSPAKQSASNRHPGQPQTRASVDAAIQHELAEARFVADDLADHMFGTWCAKARGCIRSHSDAGLAKTPPAQADTGEKARKASKVQAHFWRWKDFPKAPLGEDALVEFLNKMTDSALNIAKPQLGDAKSQVRNRFATPEDKHHAVPLAYEADAEDMRPDFLVLPIEAFSSDMKTVDQKYVNFTALRAVGESKNKNFRLALEQVDRYARGMRRAQPWVHFVLAMTMMKDKMSLVRGDSSGTERLDLVLSDGRGCIEFIRILLGLALAEGIDLGQNPDVKLRSEERSCIISKPLPPHKTTQTHHGRNSQAAVSSSNAPSAPASLSVEQSSEGAVSSSGQASYTSGASVPSHSRSSAGVSSSSKRKYSEVDDGADGADDQPNLPKKAKNVERLAFIPIKVYGHQCIGILFTAGSIRGRGTASILRGRSRRPQQAIYSGEDEQDDVLERLKEKGSHPNLIVPFKNFKARTQNGDCTTLGTIRAFLGDQLRGFPAENRALNVSLSELKRPVKYFWAYTTSLEDCEVQYWEPTEATARSKQQGKLRMDDDMARSSSPISPDDSQPLKALRTVHSLRGNYWLLTIKVRPTPWVWAPLTHEELAREVLQYRGSGIVSKPTGIVVCTQASGPSALIMGAVCGEQISFLPARASDACQASGLYIMNLTKPLPVAAKGREVWCRSYSSFLVTGLTRDEVSFRCFGFESSLPRFSSHPVCSESGERSRRSEILKAQSKRTAVWIAYIPILHLLAWSTHNYRESKATLTYQVVGLHYSPTMWADGKFPVIAQNKSGGSRHVRLPADQLIRSAEVRNCLKYNWDTGLHESIQALLPFVLDVAGPLVARTQVKHREFVALLDNGWRRFLKTKRSSRIVHSCELIRCGAAAAFPASATPRWRTTDNAGEDEQVEDPSKPAKKTHVPLTMNRVMPLVTDVEGGPKLVAFKISSQDQQRERELWSTTGKLHPNLMVPLKQVVFHIILWNNSASETWTLSNRVRMKTSLVSSAPKITHLLPNKARQIVIPANLTRAPVDASIQHELAEARFIADDLADHMFGHLVPTDMARDILKKFVVDGVVEVCESKPSVGASATILDKKLEAVQRALDAAFEGAKAMAASASHSDAGPPQDSASSGGYGEDFPKAPLGEDALVEFLNKITDSALNIAKPQLGDAKSKVRNRFAAHTGATDDNAAPPGIRSDAAEDIRRLDSWSVRAHRASVLQSAAMQQGTQNSPATTFRRSRGARTGGRRPARAVKGRGRAGASAAQPRRARHSVGRASSPQRPETMNMGNQCTRRRRVLARLSTAGVRHAEPWPRSASELRRASRDRPKPRLATRRFIAGRRGGLCWEEPLRDGGRRGTDSLGWNERPRHGYPRRATAYGLPQTTPALITTAQQAKRSSGLVSRGQLPGPPPRARPPLGGAESKRSRQIPGSVGGGAEAVAVRKYSEVDDGADGTDDKPNLPKKGEEWDRIAFIPIKLYRHECIGMLFTAGFYSADGDLTAERSATMYWERLKEKGNFKARTKNDDCTTLGTIRAFLGDQLHGFVVEKPGAECHLSELKRPVKYFWGVHDFVRGLRGAILGHEYLTQIGILHRDISENNIVLARRPGEERDESKPLKALRTEELRAADNQGFVQLLGSGRLSHMKSWPKTYAMWADEALPLIAKVKDADLNNANCPDKLIGSVEVRNCLKYNWDTGLHEGIRTLLLSSWSLFVDSRLRAFDLNATRTQVKHRKGNRKSGVDGGHWNEPTLASYIQFPQGAAYERCRISNVTDSRSKRSDSEMDNYGDAGELDDEPDPSKTAKKLRVPLPMARVAFIPQAVVSTSSMAVGLRDRTVDFGRHSAQ
ncbi:hypothetical protein BU15DRAFT_68891 [Melanogaster broomeanus]|nr:hypothetical protein BU15DRAFT_68891 [Melanogaster broomeanus]